MTNNTIFESVMEELSTNGFAAVPKVITLLYNEAMKIERSNAINAQPYERTEERKGYANGFKTKNVHARFGKITLNIPQTRVIQMRSSF